MSDAVLWRVDGPIGRITLNRPDRRNCMTAELLDAFRAAVEQARASDVRVVVITGSGSCFSAGADLNIDLQREASSRPLQPHEASYAMYQPFLSVLDIEVPVIGALNGHAVGGGFGLALVTDIRVASESSRYGANFARLGLHPGMAISYLLPRIIGVPRAAELLFTGRLFTGADGFGMGLFNRAVPAAEVADVADELAREIAESAPIAVRMMKRSFYAALDWKPREAAWQEAWAQAMTLATKDAEEGIAALLAKRPPRFSGS